MKVGFFDSGVGGLCIYDAFRKRCPEAETEYFADTANCPYGNRSVEEIVDFSRKNTEFLLSHGAGIIVVACNTATAAAIDILRREYPEIPFVGIEPAVKPAALNSKSGIVAVLATRGTFNGRLYRETSARCPTSVRVLAATADEFVKIVEDAFRDLPVPCDLQSPLLRRRLDAPAVADAVAARIEPLLAAGADRIVLGCTHFPHLRRQIERVCGSRAQVVDPSDAVARQICRLYQKQRPLT